MIPIVMLTRKPPLWADEEGGFAAVADGVGDGTVGVDFGVWAGEEEWLSEAGVGTNGVTDEVGGLLEGDAGGGADVARVSIWTFIPWLQCPLVPQMKYFLPCEESGMLVVPPL